MKFDSSMKRMVDDFRNKYIGIKIIFCNDIKRKYQINNIEEK